GAALEHDHLSARQARDGVHRADADPSPPPPRRTRGSRTGRFHDPHVPCPAGALPAPRGVTLLMSTPEIAGRVDLREARSCWVVESRKNASGVIHLRVRTRHLARRGGRSTVMCGSGFGTEE